MANIFESEEFSSNIWSRIIYNIESVTDDEIIRVIKGNYPVPNDLVDKVNGILSMFSSAPWKNSTPLDPIDHNNYSIFTMLDDIADDEDDYVMGHIHAPPENINTRACFDAESKTNALGTLERNQYMLIPYNLRISKCPVNHIGAGLNVYNPGSLAATGVYALAKAQALEFGWDNDKAIKWAVLRMEAFIAGWFDWQKLTMYKETPPSFMETFAQDGKEIMKYLETAWTLCSFLPLLAEFQFRAYGNNYQNTNDQAEYVWRAGKLAAESGIQSVVAYMDNETLFGSVLSWIDVKRPMEFLKDPETCSRYPKVFKVRMIAAPVGQTLITISVAIIALLKKGNWWAGIKEAGGYEDEKLITVFRKITADPWKYHIMHQVYGLNDPSEEELKEVEQGKNLAILFAPVLQAFFDVYGMETFMEKSQELKEYAYATKELYYRAVEVFEVLLSCETLI